MIVFSPYPSLPLSPPPSLPLRWPGTLNRRSSFLYQTDDSDSDQEKNAGSTKGISRTSSMSSHVGDETYITPYAQVNSSTLKFCKQKKNWWFGSLPSQPPNWKFRFSHDRMFIHAHIYDNLYDGQLSFNWLSIHINIRSNVLSRQLLSCIVYQLLLLSIVVSMGSEGHVAKLILVP
jgi:hypothetical protein